MGDQIKSNVLVVVVVGGGGYCIYGINERWGNLKERDNLEDIGVGGGG